MILMIFLRIMKKIHILLLITILIIQSGCGMYRKTDAKNIPTNVDDRVAKNKSEGKGIRFGSLKERGGDFQFASSNPMWRAALDILDFAPLNNVDYAGGIIVTDWFNDKNDPKNSVKISVKFLSNEIRSDGLEVILFKKKCEGSNNCTVSKIQSELNNKIKLQILKKAAKIKKDNVAKKDKKKN